jgi:putative NADH-flavin reductase
LGVSQPLKNDPVVIEGVRNIIKAMQEMKIKRLIYLSFIAVGEGRKDAGFLIKNLISKIVRKEIEDHEEKERLIQNSQLEWTIIHPPKLTNAPGKNNYRTGENIKANQFLPTLSRVDLADFMLKQVKDRSFIHKKVRIMY